MWIFLVKWPRSPRSCPIRLPLTQVGGFLLCLVFSKFSYIVNYQFCEFCCLKKKFKDISVLEFVSLFRGLVMSDFVIGLVYT